MKKNKEKSKWDNPGSYTPCNIGGQALLEGIMMRGTSSVAVACRDENGEITVFSERTKPHTSWYYKVPVIRGAVSFFYSLFDGVKYIGKSAEVFAGDDEEAQLGPAGMFLAVLLSFVLAIGLFIALPKLIHWLIWDLAVNLSSLVSNSVYILIISLTDGIIKVAILILYMWGISNLKDIKRTFMYHGGEHRCINCYEHNLDLTVENVQSCSTRHARCGTTFLFYTIIVSIIVITLVLWLISLTGYSVALMKEAVGNDTLGTLLYNVINIGISILCLPLMAGISYEFLKLVAKAPDNKFTLIFKAPGFMLQALTTKEPEDDMAEVALAAFKKVLELDSDPNALCLDFYEMTYAEARRYTEEKYAAAGIDDASEADWALVSATGCERNELRNLVKLNKTQAKKLKGIVESRITGLPLDYCTGESFFRKNTLKVTRDVHLPRMETELVAEKAIKLINERGYKTALDLMTGSGCIALALATETKAAVTATDISDEALKVAEENFAGKVKTMKSDVFSSVEGTFDIIVSNPPYIKTAEIETLAPEVQCQPHIALDGGEDGLKFYRIIAESSKAFINDGGTLVLEIGHDQGESVKTILEEKGFENVTVEKDLSGSDRIVTAFIGQ